MPLDCKKIKIKDEILKCFLKIPKICVSVGIILLAERLLCSLKVQIQSKINPFCAPQDM